MFNYRNIILFLIGLILFIHLTNTVINSLIKEGGGTILTSTPPTSGEKEKPAEKSQVKIEPKFKEKTHHPLTPEDPAKYGIISTSEADTPRSQMEWDLFMEKALIKSKTLDDPNAKAALEQMKKTPEEYAAREEEVDARIKLFEKTLETNPTDPDLKQRLQTLYMLKSMGKVLKDTVTSPK